MHRNSRLLFDHYARSFIEDGARVLEIGPDKNDTYRSEVTADVAGWETLDFAGGVGDPPTHELKDPYHFPLDDNSYDVVLSGNVLEHIPKPWRWMPEVARVIKPGGHVITIVPVSWPFHEVPVDCWRVYPDGLSALYEDSGLDVVWRSGGPRSSSRLLSVSRRICESAWGCGSPSRASSLFPARSCGRPDSRERSTRLRWAASPSSHPQFQGSPGPIRATRAQNAVWKGPLTTDLTSVQP